ncbi:group III truncated hemoglobin [Xanthobacter variabilis]|uniref:group III truncated hemoglobin n=1 Tax=Xanthobacter variabilis TaxID=3119932 RepID=UPI00372AE56E
MTTSSTPTLQTSAVPLGAGQSRGSSTGVGPNLPSASAGKADFGGVSFVAAPKAPARPGIFILTRSIGDLAYPAYIGEAEDMALAEEAVRAALPAETAVTDGLFYMERPNARLRAHALHDLVGKYDPPLNTTGRKGPAAPELAALIADRADVWPNGARKQLASEIHVTEADLDRLVREFYAAAGQDPQLGPIFARAIPDWEEHYRIVQNFWSRALLGTGRYTGNPFSAHISLQLKPEHFTRWVALFTQTARRVLEPAAADRAIAKVEHMSTCFQAGLFLPPVNGGAHPHAALPGLHGAPHHA